MNIRVIESPPSTTICETESHSESSITVMPGALYEEYIDPHYLNGDYKCAFYNRLISNKHGVGIGGALVDATLDYCDAHDIYLVNSINAYGELEFGQLREFYKRHGFVEMQTELETGLIYYPNSRKK